MSTPNLNMYAWAALPEPVDVCGLPQRKTRTRLVSIALYITSQPLADATADYDRSSGNTSWTPASRTCHLEPSM